MFAAAFKTIVEGPYGLARIESITGSVVRTFWDSRIRQLVQLCLGSGGIAYISGLTGPFDRQVAPSAERFRPRRVLPLALGLSLASFFWDAGALFRSYSEALTLDIGAFNSLWRDPVVNGFVTFTDSMAISTAFLDRFREGDEGQTGNLAANIGAGWLLFRVADIGLCHGKSAPDLVCKGFFWLGDVKDVISSSIIEFDQWALEMAGTAPPPPSFQISQSAKAALCALMPLCNEVGRVAGILDDDRFAARKTVAVSLVIGTLYYLAETRCCFYPITTEAAQAISAKSVISILDTLAYSALFSTIRQEGENGFTSLALGISWLLFRACETTPGYFPEVSTQLLYGNWAPAIKFYEKIVSWIPEI